VPPDPYVLGELLARPFVQPCFVDLAAKTKASLHVSISCELLNCILMGTEPITITRQRS
jgi:hypothetical protein